jgi:hypothetical protein
MGIALTCEKCGKLYEMPDSLAGKRARCKQCKHEFRIPVPAGRAAVGQSADDPYGLDDVPSRTVRRPTIDDDDGPPPPRAGYKARKKASSHNEELNTSTLYHGIWFLVMGVGAFVLPFFGLQWKALHIMPPAWQAGIGVFLLAIGSGLLLRSGVNFAFPIAGFMATGLAGLIFLGMLIVGSGDGALPNESEAMAGPNAQPPGLPPRPRTAAVQPRPNQAPPGFQPDDQSTANVPVARFPTADPAPATIGSSPAPVPGLTPGFPGDANSSSGNVHIALSNARASRVGGSNQLSFAADYRMEGAPPAGQVFVWVIEAPGVKSTVQLTRLASQGTLTGKLFGAPAAGQATSFTMYVGIKMIGQGDESLQVISDRLTVQAPAGGMPVGPGAVPSAGRRLGRGPMFPRPPGMPQGPGNRSMPRPGFGP